MCFGSKSDQATSEVPVRLKELAPPGDARPATSPSRPQPTAGSVKRPPSSRRERPPTSGGSASEGVKRPPSSRRDRPSTSGGTTGEGVKRPSSSRRARPSTSSGSTSEGIKRPTSSRKGRPHTSGSSLRQRPSSSSGETPSSSYRPTTAQRKQPQFKPTQHPEDRDIITNVRSFTSLIDQHAEEFYHREYLGSRLTQELDDPRSRHAAIRQYIARHIIDSITMAGRDRYTSQTRCNFCPQLNLTMTEL
jgi:hypothetical protein